MKLLRNPAHWPRLWRSWREKLETLFYLKWNPACWARHIHAALAQFLWECMGLPVEITDDDIRIQ